MAVTSVVVPVVFYDGKYEYDIKSIVIHRPQSFNRFVKTVTQTTGVPYNNVTTYLVDSNRTKNWSKRSKVIISGKNFHVIDFRGLVRQRHCYLHVVLKRTCWWKRRILNQTYEERVHECQMMKPYFINSGLIVPVPVMVIPILETSFQIVEEPSRVLCKDCSEAEKEGSEAPFHFCVYDDVVVGGFRTTAGPISPPRFVNEIRPVDIEADFKVYGFWR